MTLKSISQRHDIIISDLSEAFADAVKTTFKLHGVLNQDSLAKYFEDNLLTLDNFSDKEIEFLTDYFKKETGKDDTVDQIESSDAEPSDIIRKKMQTSGAMSAAIGMSRPTGYKTKVIPMYGSDSP